MSLPVIILLSFLALMSTSVLATQMLSVVTVQRYAAVRIADEAESSAQLTFISNVAQHVSDNVAAKADPGATLQEVASSWSAPLTISGTKYVVNYAGSVNSAGTFATSNGSGSPVNDSAENVQDAAFVKEERFSGSVRVQVVDPTKQFVVATRTRFLTFRVMRSAPYVLVDGARELGAVRGASSQGAAAGGSSLGDAGGPGDSGGVPGGSSAPDAASPLGYQDTTIKAHAGCSNVNANDGLPWGTGTNSNAVSMVCTYGAITSQQGPVDDLHGKQWTTPNTNDTQWSW